MKPPVNSKQLNQKKSRSKWPNQPTMIGNKKCNKGRWPLNAVAATCLQYEKEKTYACMQAKCSLLYGERNDLLWVHLFIMSNPWDNDHDNNTDKQDKRARPTTVQLKDIVAWTHKPCEDWAATTQPT
jgi:hypothetical protein